MGEDPIFVSPYLYTSMAIEWSGTVRNRIWLIWCVSALLGWGKCFLRWTDAGLGKEVYERCISGRDGRDTSLEKQCSREKDRCEDRKQLQKAAAG